jgi:hypothetical protein
MDERERIRAKVFDAAERLDSAEAALSDALGRQAAYRSSKWWFEGKENPNAGPRPADGTPANELLRWVLTPTPEQEEFRQRRVESWGTEILSERQRAWDALYDEEFNRAVDDLKAGQNAAGIEYAIAYFEADPWHFHSGYLKQDLARYLRRVLLSDDQRQRLREALLGAITKGRREDLKEYVSLGRTLDSSEFRDQLRALAEDLDEGTAYRAKRMLSACELMDPGRPRVGSHQPR